MTLLLFLLTSCTPQDATFTKARYHAWLASGSSATLDEVRRSCNDGRDNDGDGLSDDKDPDCQGPLPTTDDLHACVDGVDNDNDEGASGGGIDEDDADCTRGLGELDFLKIDKQSTKVLNCNDGIEIAGDCPAAWDEGEPEYFTWLGDDVFIVDQDDLEPWRSEAILTGEGGFQLTVHQDLGNGYDFRFAFVVDPEFRPSVCIQEGQTCFSGVDDDGDGWVDHEDPDCLYGSWEVGFTDSQCNNGYDDDGDGAVDGLDEDCAHPFADAETSADASCLDDADNDGDSWNNDEDPDCSIPGQAESGVHMYACSDGLDNDGDGFVDSDDPACANAYDNGEDGPDGKYRCSDDYDNDGDGWVDEEDLDCELYDTESGFQPIACSDGEDNDGDGFIDAEDSGCLGGGDASEEDLADDTCTDETDNDEDGWVDLEDPDCLFGVAEDDTYFGLSACNDGIDNPDEDGVLDGKIDEDDRDCKTAQDNSEIRIAGGSCLDGEDNDADGWLDGDDPDCAFGNAEQGFLTLACNDGQDNDGDTLVDVEDLDCITGWLAAETPLDANCTDGLDNDSDGWSDLDDWGCLQNGIEDAGLVTECNDGLDNDGDGDIDADDAECQGSTDQVESTLDTCIDGLDNDGDGWLDAEDPDCQNGVISHERGFSDARCNDGLDNDEDGLIDAADVDGCTTAGNTWESDVDECTDGLDNDGDGWVDNKDPDCSLDTVTEGAPDGTSILSSACNDGVDNDGDGVADIDDPDCGSGWDNLEEANDNSGQPVPYDVDYGSAVEHWSADECDSDDECEEPDYNIYYLNAGSYQTNPADDEEFWSLPRQWLSGYAISKFAAEEFDVLPNDFAYIGMDAQSPSDSQYQAAVNAEKALAEAQALELENYGLMDGKFPMEFKVEGNEWRPVDLAMAGLDNWVERHHSWVRIHRDSKVEAGGEVKGDFQIYMAGFESASALVVRGEFNVPSLKEDKWAYPVLEDEIRERNNTEVCEF